jgi:hypothetical protein
MGCDWRYVGLGRVGTVGILDAVHVLRPARSGVVVKPNSADATPMHCEVHALCGPCLTRSRVGTHR